MVEICSEENRMGEWTVETPRQIERERGGRCKNTKPLYRKGKKKSTVHVYHNRHNLFPFPGEYRHEWVLSRKNEVGETFERDPKAAEREVWVPSIR